MSNILILSVRNFLSIAGSCPCRWTTPPKKIPRLSFLFFAKMKKKFSLIFIIFFILYLDVGTLQPEDNLSNTH